MYLFLVINLSGLNRILFVLNNDFLNGKEFNYNLKKKPLLSYTILEVVELFLIV